MKYWLVEIFLNESSQNYFFNACIDGMNKILELSKEFTKSNDNIFKTALSDRLYYIFSWNKPQGLFQKYETEISFLYAFHSV